MIIVDDNKYDLSKFEDEVSLENIVNKYSKKIFGETSIYIPMKKQLKSKAGRGSIPDGYAIQFTRPRQLYIVEAELSKHSLNKHIHPQLLTFISGFKEPESKKKLVNILYESISNNPKLHQWVERCVGPDIYKFLSELIDLDPGLILVIDESDKKLEEVVDDLSPQIKHIIELKAYRKPGSKVNNVYSFIDKIDDINDYCGEFLEDTKKWVCYLCDKEYGGRNGDIQLIEHIREKHDIDPEYQSVIGWEDNNEKRWQARESKNHSP
jgi:hypothetical protein